MPTIVKQGNRGASIQGPTVKAASEIGPTTYGEGQGPKQETWEDYQPEVGREMKAAASREKAAETPAPEPVVRADGGDFRRESAARSKAEGEPQPASADADGDVKPVDAADTASADADTVTTPKPRTRSAARKGGKK
jgi:hypothetical protein